MSIFLAVYFSMLPVPGQFKVALLNTKLDIDQRDSHLNIPLEKIVISLTKQQHEQQTCACGEKEGS